ncbi:complex I NDUFA9 subunit family protein [Halothiobacillus sp. DCM-1]|uniref:complex I NDUFA9 subunit family protein n=1 Tax=Halothiobacillus sp. DCM-1 TaxID=3112558 RepID=UPI00325471C4
MSQSITAHGGALGVQAPRVVVLGGTGFVGRYLTRALVAAGYAVTIPTRHSARHRDMQLWRGVRLVDGSAPAASDWATPRAAAPLSAVMAGHAVLVNLVGILNERGHDGRGFAAAHVRFTQQALTAAHEAGIPRYLHMSALQADAERGTSFYLRSKGAAEDWAHAFGAAQGIAVTSFRPSVIFGAEDAFLNRFARLAALMPGIFPLACAEARFAPVFVGDVASVMVRAIRDQNSVGQRLDLCGPTQYSLRALVAYAAAAAGHPRWVIGLPDWAARLQARLLERVPGQPFTRDNFASLQIPSVCPPGCAPQPTTLESVAPGYLRAR